MHTQSKNESDLDILCLRVKELISQSEAALKSGTETCSATQLQAPIIVSYRPREVPPLEQLYILNLYLQSWLLNLYIFTLRQFFVFLLFGALSTALIVLLLLIFPLFPLLFLIY